MGHPLSGATASWKKCSPGQDRLLGEMTPDELNKVKGDENLNLGLLTKMAYPIWAKTKWPEVKGFFLAPEGAEAAALSPELRGELQQVIDAGRPMVFNSKDGHPPFVIVWGKKVYEVLHSTDYYMYSTDPAYLERNPG